MQRKDQIDMFGALSLVAFSALLGFNQVVIKVMNDGLQPVFAAGARSFGAMTCLWLWMRFRGIPVEITRDTWPWGLLMGVLFGTEFMLMFQALDWTTVARSSIIFYSMPVWLTLAAHVLIPGEIITRRKALGLALAMAGVGLAMLSREPGGQASLLGDLFALLAAMLWATIALLTRVSPFATVKPEMQLFWQVSVSAVLLLAVAPLFGPLIRDFTPMHAAGFVFQAVVVVTAAFLFWFWMLKIYPASGVASFSFLSPVFGVLFGWLLLEEVVGPSLIGALILVALGLVLINRPARGRRPQVPQKV